MKRQTIIGLALIAVFFFLRIRSEVLGSDIVDNPDGDENADALDDLYSNTIGAVGAIIMAQSPSEDCIARIRAHEGCRLTAYFDVKGYSIGWGHFGVPAGTVWTQDQADSQLLIDVDAACASVLKYINVALNQNQLDALTDFTYSLGSGALQESTLRRVLNAGSYDAVPVQILRWGNVNGQPNSGVMARRQAEVDVWNTPVATVEVADTGDDANTDYGDDGDY